MFGYAVNRVCIVSKNTKSINSSISNQLKNRNDESNENNYINMLDETNITYLWYMETKKRYKNFNYNVSSDCKELFTEYVILIQKELL